MLCTSSGFKTKLCANRKTCTQFMRSKLTLLSLSSRRRFMRLQLVYKIFNDIDCTRQLKGYLVKRSELHDRNFRDSSLIDGMRTTSTMGQCSFKSAAAREWNSLPRNISDTPILVNLTSYFRANSPALDPVLQTWGTRVQR